MSTKMDKSKFFLAPKHMFKLMGNVIKTILGAQTILIEKFLIAGNNLFWQH